MPTNGDKYRVFFRGHRQDPKTVFEQGLSVMQGRNCENFGYTDGTINDYKAPICFTTRPSVAAQFPLNRRYSSHTWVFIFIGKVGSNGRLFKEKLNAFKNLVDDKPSEVTTAESSNTENNDLLNVQATGYLDYMLNEHLASEKGDGRRSYGYFMKYQYACEHASTVTIKPQNILAAIKSNAAYVTDYHSCEGIVLSQQRRYIGYEFCTNGVVYNPKHKIPSCFLIPMKNLIADLSDPKKHADRESNWPRVGYHLRDNWAIEDKSENSKREDGTCKISCSIM